MLVAIIVSLLSGFTLVTARVANAKLAEKLYSHLYSDEPTDLLATISSRLYNVYKSTELYRR